MLICVLSNRRARRVAPGWVPANALAHYDFEQGLYWDGAAELNVADAISDPARVVTVSDGSGLTIEPDGVQLLGGLRDKILLGSFTALVRFVPENSSHQAFLVLALDNSGDDQVTMYAVMSGGTVTEVGYDAHFIVDGNPSGDRFVGGEATPGTPETENRIALSRSPGSIHVSMNGSAASSDTSALAGVLLDYVLAGEHNQATGVRGRILSITVYPLLAASALPALTSLS